MITEQQDQSTGEEQNNNASAVEYTSKHGPRKCENPECGNDFIPKTARAKYCSASCNARASEVRRGIRPVPGQSVNPVAAPASFQPQSFGLAGVGGFGIPPHADMMIKHFEKEAARWEKKYDQEVADHKATKQKLDEAKEELRDNEKPGGLSGLIDSPAGLELIKIFGPVISSKMGGGAPQIAGPSEGPAAEMAAMFGKWVSTLSESSQQSVWALIQTISNMDEEKMNYLVRGSVQSWQQQQQ